MATQLHLVRRVRLDDQHELSFDGNELSVTGFDPDNVETHTVTLELTPHDQALVLEMLTGRKSRAGRNNKTTKPRPTKPKPTSDEAPKPEAGS